ncbi:MAG: zinc ribbon domain-containing protein [Acidobacteriota bacterium]|nr:zinc ribbon domain-containing protein [Acidobacteriota bacterium]
MDLLIQYLLWVVVFALVGAAIGQKRGRALAGFFLGGLIGPLGWLVLLLGPDYSGQFRKCPYCAESVKTEAVICKHCGKSLGSAGSVAAAFGSSPPRAIRSSDDDFDEWQRGQETKTRKPTG